LNGITPTQIINPMKMILLIGRKKEKEIDDLVISKDISVKILLFKIWEEIRNREKY
jgi:hypothetical protein